MQSYKLIFYIPLFSLFVQSSCKKTNSESPKVTTYGPYKFAAKVNGENFIPSQDMFSMAVFIPPIRLDNFAGSTVGSNNLLLSVYRAEDKASLYLSIYNVTGVGKYSLNACINRSDGLYTRSWRTNNSDTGFVEITQYSSSIKATFSFKARNTQDSSVVTADGFFSYN